MGDSAADGAFPRVQKLGSKAARETGCVERMETTLVTGLNEGRPTPLIITADDERRGSAIWPSAASHTEEEIRFI